MLKRHIYLIGMMGCGKSTLGRKLARSLAYPHIDTDAYIEQQNRQKITDIFTELGQAGFRDIEHKSLSKLSQLHKAHVISTGGGLPCHYNNVNIIQQSGYSIYLEANASFLYSRLRYNQNKRPLIAHKSKAECLKILEQMIAIRQPYYLQADIVLKAMQGSPQNVIQALQEQSNWQWSA